MTNQELVDCVKNININIRQLSRFLSKHHPELWEQIIGRTNFLEEHFTKQGRIVPLEARLYCLTHNIISHPTCKCPDCSNTVNWSHHVFQDYCSLECVGKDSNVVKKREATSLKNHGTTNVLKLKEVQLEIFKKLNDRYGGIGFASSETNAKIQSTMEDRYGVKYAGQSSEIRNTIEATNNSKYGNKCSLHGKEIEKKTLSTNMERRCVPYPMMSKEVRDKSVAKCRENWGVDNYVQTREYHQRAHKPYFNPKYPNMSFGSSWEFKVYDFLTEHAIPFEYQIEPIPYEYDNGIHYYHPDFLINGRIYEVKGNQFFKIDESTGKEIMCVPNRKTYTEEEYLWRCGKEEAKHQCMLANNVVILRHSQIKNLSIDLFG